jgi:hypothetical protein
MTKPFPEPPSYTPTVASPNKFSKYSQEVLASLNFCVLEDLQKHYEDVSKRLLNEQTAMKPRRSLITALMQEQASTQKALLPYSNLKPSGDPDREDLSKRPTVAIKLTLTDD